MKTTEILCLSLKLVITIGRCIISKKNSRNIYKLLKNAINHGRLPSSGNLLVTRLR